MWPLLLRPEPRFWLSVSASIGLPLWSCGLTTLTSARRPADVGFTFWRGMLLLRREIDFLARLQAHVGLLPVAPATVESAEALFLAADIQDLHVFDLDLEHRLDGGLHFRLGGVRHHAKDHLLLLLGD